MTCPKCSSAMKGIAGNFFDAGEFREVASGGALDGFWRWLSERRR